MLKVLLGAALVFALASPVDAGPVKFAGKYTGITAASKAIAKGATWTAKTTAKGVAKVAQVVY